MPADRIPGTDGATSSPPVNPRVLCVARLSSYLARYELAGNSLRVLIADQERADDREPYEAKIDGVSRQRNSLLWFALEEQRKAVELGAGEWAFRAMQRSLDRDAAKVRGEMEMAGGAV